jgi:hypothetical protein
VVPSPQAVRALETDRNSLLPELSPEPAITMPGMVGRKSVEQPNQQLFVKRFRSRRIAVRGARQSEDFTSPAFGEGEMRANEFDALPSSRRA